MARDAYATPLYEVDSDIEKVGGKGAYLGMLRETPDGKEYVLVQSHDITADFSSLRLILGYKGGQAFKVVLAASGGRCDGVSPVTNRPMTAGKYFWMQTHGRADNVLVLSGDAGTPIASNGSGVGVSLDLSTTFAIDTDGTEAFTLTVNNNGVIGWCIANAVNNLCSIQIRPNYQWTVVATGVATESADYGTDA